MLVSDQLGIGQIKWMLMLSFGYRKWWKMDIYSQIVVLLRKSPSGSHWFHLQQKCLTPREHYQVLIGSHPESITQYWLDDFLEFGTFFFVKRVSHLVLDWNCQKSANQWFQNTFIINSDEFCLTPIDSIIKMWDLK